MVRPNNYPKNPAALWEIFYQFTQTPRPSKKEEKISKYIVRLAEDYGLSHKKDKAGNILINVPGTAGRESEPPLLIQNHVDMVTDCSKGLSFDFENMPLTLRVENDWVKASGTTLGADNGIGCAAALATFVDKSVSHPPLELLFTMDEETGLHGALNLDGKMVTANRMLNLDSEQWGTLYIGCAGGISYELVKEMAMQPHEGKYYKIQIEGLTGGHSGLDIHRDRGNAIKMLADLLYRLRDLGPRIAEFRGGKAHNIIPRDAFVIFSADDSAKISAIMDTFYKEYRSFLAPEEKNFKVMLEKLGQKNVKVLSHTDSIDFINYMGLLPHGVHAIDNNTSDRVVSQSNNLALQLLVGGKCYSMLSLRFFDRNQIRSLEKSLEILANVYGMKLQRNSEYPSWKPQKENPVMEKVKKIYTDTYGQKPAVTAIHAGLECGILISKIGKIDGVSFGPTILDAHSPDERVSISSVENFWNLFVKVLEKI